MCLDTGKQYTKAYCKYSIVSLQKNIYPCPETVKLCNIQNFHRKVRDYMYAYFEGYVAGRQLVDKVKSHKRVQAKE